MVQRSILALTFTLLASSAMAQSPAFPAPQPAQQQTRGEPNSQQLLDWQRERADEYYRRLREYVASVAKMA